MAIRTTGVDAFTSGNVYTPNFKSVIATKRELAVLLPVRLAPNTLSADYQAGTVLAQYNSSAGSLQNYYVNYVNSAGSAQGTAVCILNEFCSNQALTSAASTPLSVAVFSGILWKNLLVGLDSNAISNLGGKSITDATGNILFKF